MWIFNQWPIFECVSFFSSDFTLLFSHPKLLTLPSELFYDRELEAKADTFVTHSMVNWSQLPNKKVPLIFHGVVGEDQREARSPSYFNPEEAAIVVQYVQDLLETKDGAKKVILKLLALSISKYLL